MNKRSIGSFRRRLKRLTTKRDYIRREKNSREK
jgi:hypothetical protein